MTGAQGVRARVRAEMVEEIKAAGRRQLAEVGAADLSLRAVAREVGLVSSAVYRYFASRDELLTALVVDAYGSLGEAAEVAARGRGTFEARWVAVTGGIRAWAVAHPHEYALLYGSPVPGYQAPEATIVPAGRAARAALGVVVDGVASGEVVRSGTAVPRALRADVARLRQALDVEVPGSVAVRFLGAWAEVFGLVSFELFGHLTNVISDPADHFALQARRAARHLAAP